MRMILSFISSSTHLTPSHLGQSSRASSSHRKHTAITFIWLRLPEREDIADVTSFQLELSYEIANTIFIIIIILSQWENIENKPGSLCLKLHCGTVSLVLTRLLLLRIFCEKLSLCLPTFKGVDWQTEVSKETGLYFAEIILPRLGYICYFFKTFFGMKNINLHICIENIHKM